MTASTTIRLERSGDGVALVVLDGAPLNLNTLASIAQLQQAFAAVDCDDSVRCVVVTGAGDKAFCAGSDIKEFPSVWDDVVGKKLRKENDAFRCIEQCSRPVIAAIEGLAFGGGCELAMACDLRLMSATARIALPEIRLGVFPGSGGLYRLPRLVGSARAMEMMLLGAPLDAEQALQAGLVNRVVPAGETVRAAVEMAGEIAQQAPAAVRAIKRGVQAAQWQTYEEALALTLQLSDAVFRTADCAEGVRAFAEKRAPRFGAAG